MIRSCSMAQRQTLDYVDADGTNVIQAWLDGFGRDRDKVKAKLDYRLNLIRSQAVIPDTIMEKLAGEADGIYEIKLMVNNVPQRILSCYGPGRGKVTMLFPATEHNDRLRPPGARATAYRRSQEIDEPGRTVLHDY